jgi:GxxExxY protein
MTELKDTLTFAIIGAAMEVHRQIGPGFLEVVYQEALEREFKLRGIPYKRELELYISYKGEILPCTYKADFVCYDKIIVELKAISMIGSIHEAQVINYLKATGKRVGLLLNFGSQSLQQSRLIYGYN